MRHSIRAVSLWWLIVLVPIMAAANNAPKAKKDVATTVAGRSVTIPVTDNDSDRDGRIDRKTVELVGRDPLGGTARVKRRKGKVIYTPDPDFSGQDTFKYRVKDNRGALSNKARVTVTVAVGPVVITSLHGDSGLNNSDFITNNVAPTLIGVATTDIIEVTLYENDTPILPAALVNRNGTWSYNLVLDEGDYTFTAIGKNAFGQESSPSAAQKVTIDTTTPSEPEVNQVGTCNELEVQTPGLVPPKCVDNPSNTGFGCLKLCPIDFEVCPPELELGTPVHVVLQKIGEDGTTVTGPPRTYSVSDDCGNGVLQMVITDPLEVLPQSYDLTFIVSDVAGNRSSNTSVLTLDEPPERPTLPITSRAP